MNEPLVQSSPITVDGEMYSAVVALRNAELAALWNRFNVYLVLNGGLLATIVSLGVSHPQHKLIALAKPFGVALSIAWLCVEFFGRKSLQYRDQRVEAFEERFLRGDLQHIHSFVGRPSSLDAQEVIAYLVVLTFVAAWGVVACQL